MSPNFGMSAAAAAAVALLLGYNDFPFASANIEAADAKWYAPAKSDINDLDAVSSGSGVYGFIYNSSKTPDEEYGVYNWCNMPHVRRSEYAKPSDEYELKYVELMHRHHKRTPYSSNAFPVESYRWNCDDIALFYYAQPFAGPDSGRAYQQGYISPVNPFIPSGWIGTCKFPQITAGGLEDSWQHGADLWGVYHDLLGFLPDRDSSKVPHSVKYRVTNNIITSQVAGMVINGMWGTTEPVPILVQAEGIDGLEPQYECPAASKLFGQIKSGSNVRWQEHLNIAADLYHTLDDISGVPADDDGFHASFDHYYDNLSARECHDKPLPCKLVNGENSTTCVTQELADTVYRWGHWEYSHIYRDTPSSLPASAASLGVWIGELTAHLREAIAGENDVIYFHNVAHDGSVSRLLSILQLDKMVWPGMGSEVVFELYRKKQDNTSPTPTPIAPNCRHDNCLRHLIRQPTSALSYCEQVASPSADLPAQCGSASRVSSACSCLGLPTGTASTAPTKATDPAAGEYFLRVLFGGQVLRSSSPALGLMEMVPARQVLNYLDGLVGAGASKVKDNCN